MNFLSLFAGIGGLDLGLERAGMTCVGQVEIDEYCQRVLAKHWPEVPRHDDVRTAADWWAGEPRPRVDLICGGFPCQPVSLAGRRLAQDDKRWLWPEMAATIRALRPRYVLMENVPGLLGRGLGEVVGDLATRGYDADWDCIPAAALGAPHRRDRVWIVATDTERIGLRQQPVTEPRRIGAAVISDDGPAGIVADTESDGRRAGWSRRPAGHGSHRPVFAPTRLAHTQGQRCSAPRAEVDPEVGADRAPSRAGECRRVDPWAVEPDVGRVADGVPDRVDRLHALGNAVVPQVAEYVGRLILTHDRLPAAPGCAPRPGGNTTNDSIEEEVTG